MNWLWGGPFAAVIGVLAYQARFLSADGTLAAGLLGWVIFGAGGLTFSVPILLFFVTSSLLSKVGQANKARLRLHAQDGRPRNARQVLANGLPATAALLGWSVTQTPVWAEAFLAALAAATADTWATEIGVLAKARPRSILDGRPLEPGSSGGVTLLGTTAALAGAGLVVAIGLLVLAASGVLPWTLPRLTLLTGVGFGAQWLDSLLGAGWQARFRCDGCGQEVESRPHCPGHAVTKHTGLNWLDNDAVNLLTGVAALLAVLVLD